HAQRTDATVGLDRDGAVGAALVRASAAAEYDGRHGRWRERALELRSRLRWLRSGRWPPAHEAKTEAVSLSRSLGWRCRRPSRSPTHAGGTARMTTMPAMLSLS